MANLTTLETFMSLMMRSDAPEFLNNRKIWLNEAQRKIGLLEPWYFTEAEETFSTAAQTYVLGSRYTHITAVWRTSGSLSPLELMPIDIGSTNLLAASGLPTHYRTPTDERVTFVPSPDVSYSFRVAGHKFMVDFVNPGDESTLGTIKPYVLVFAALIEASLHLGRDPSIWKARFDEEMAELRDHWSKRGKG